MNLEEAAKEEAGIMTLEEARIEIQSQKDTFEEYEPGGTRDQFALKIALSSIRAVSRYHEALDLEPEDILSETNIGKVVCALHELKKFKELGDMDHLRELVEADRNGRCVVLPVLPALSPGTRGSEIFILLDSGEIVEDGVCDIWIGLNNSGKLTLNFSTFDSGDFETADVGKRIFWDVESAQQAAFSPKGEPPC